MSTMSITREKPVQAVRSETPSTVKASRQGFLCMWHGLSFGGFLRMMKLRPDTGIRSSPRLLSIAATGVINSVENGIESLLFGRRVAATKIEHPPIFILGHWRSGTTLLHNLLTLDSNVTFPNLYQCMFPGHFLLTEKIVAPATRFILPKTRPMDNIATNWSTPQEDEIALALDCGISPYLMLAFHNRRNVYERYFDPREMTIEEREIWKNSLLTLMKKLTIRSNRSIVMKSPSHTYRIPILLEMFPDAKFVYIYRDPYAVYQSTMHLRRTMFTENALGPAHLETCSDDALFFYEKCIRTYEETKGMIPAGNLSEIRFEDLEQDPLAGMEKTYADLSLPGWNDVEPKIRAELAGLSSYKKNSFKMDRPTMEMLHDRLKWIFELYGYPGRLDSPQSQNS